MLKTNEFTSNTPNAVQRHGNNAPFFQPEESREAFFGSRQRSEPFFKAPPPNGSTPNPSAIQAKLTIGAPNDVYEQEADAMADKVVQKLSTGESRPSVQRMCAECAAEKEEGAVAPKLQAKAMFESNEERAGGPVQRKCAAYAAEKIQRMGGEEGKEPGLQAKIIQRMGGAKEEELQEKRIQRMGDKEEEPQVQTKPDVPGLQASPDLESRLNATKGSGSPLPGDTRTAMESSFGADFSGVRVHTNSGAVQMNQELGAQAFTHGSDIYFNSEKYDTQSSGGQRLLAHELTHTVQQTIGNNNIQRLIGLKTPNLMNAEPVIQRYTTYSKTEQSGGHALGWKHPGPDIINVADDGRFAVGESGADAWAESSLLSSAEAKLKSIKSDVQLIEGARSVSGKDPDSGSGGTSKTLKEVKVLNRSGGGPADLTADCGTTARQVCGINDSSKKFAAAIKDKDNVDTETYTKSETYRGGAHTTTEAWFESILALEFGSGLSATAARARYDALSISAKDAFDRKYGINKYAAPEVGQAITIDRPKGWNFHFAGVILKSGGDYATVENYPGTGRDSQSWYFEIYGPKPKGQTFFDEWKDSSGSTAMVVESDQARTGKTTTTTNLVLDCPDGTPIKALKQENASWVKVSVLSGVLAGQTGWISNDALPPDVLKSINGQETKTIKRTSLVVTSLAGGTKLFVFKKSNTWRQVTVTDGSYAGKYGWINNQHYEVL